MKEVEEKEGSSLNTFVFIGIAIAAILYLLAEDRSSQDIGSKIMSLLPYGLIALLYFRTIYLENRIEKLEKNKSEKIKREL